MYSLWGLGCSLLTLTLVSAHVAVNPREQLASKSQTTIYTSRSSAFCSKYYSAFPRRTTTHITVTDAIDSTVTRTEGTSTQSDTVTSTVTASDTTQTADLTRTITRTRTVTSMTTSTFTYTPSVSTVLTESCTARRLRKRAAATQPAPTQCKVPPRLKQQNAPTIRSGCSCLGVFPTTSTSTITSTVTTTKVHTESIPETTITSTMTDTSTVTPTTSKISYVIQTDTSTELRTSTTIVTTTPTTTIGRATPTSFLLINVGDGRSDQYANIRDEANIKNNPLCYNSYEPRKFSFNQDGILIDFNNNTVGAYDNDGEGREVAFNPEYYTEAVTCNVRNCHLECQDDFGRTDWIIRYRNAVDRAGRYVGILTAFLYDPDTEDVGYGQTGDFIVVAA